MPSTNGQHQNEVSHPSSAAPLCQGCEQLDLPYLDLDCIGCLALLSNRGTSVSQLFAVARQWVPQTQQKIDLIVREVLNRGAHVDDRDGLTDMTLLHYACKSGACGVGDPATATHTVAWLLDKGADPSLRCRWTDMAAVHYAAYFNVVPVLELLLKAQKERICIDSSCREFEGGTPLHIAATNLCLEAADLLVQQGASLTATDNLGRTPVDCLPSLDIEDGSPPGLDRIVSSLYLLLQAPCANGQSLANGQTSNGQAVSGKALLQALGLQLGDRVTIQGSKMGTLRFCGTTHFAPGIWAGIELDEACGKNDGTVKGFSYFNCPPNYGIFALVSKVSKCGLSRDVLRSSPRPTVHHGKVDVSHIAPKVETRRLVLRRHEDVQLGDRVSVGHRKGIVRFKGSTSFSAGTWFGIELDKPCGKNDGTVQGISYFSCEVNRGLFAPAHRVYLCPPNCTSGEEEFDVGSDQGSSGDLTNSLSRSSTDADYSASPISSSSPACSRKTPRGKISVPGGKHCWLTTGVNVFVNNEIGILRYVGPVGFAEGTWLGVELRSACGKNDGSVQGQRYFTCKQGHGLLVKPNRVTIRGINGAKLLRENRRTLHSPESQ